MIDLATQEGIARIFLNRHEKANALDIMQKELLQLWEEAPLRKLRR